LAFGSNHAVAVVNAVENWRFYVGYVANVGGAVIFSPSIVANVVSVSIVSWQSWQQRQQFQMAIDVLDLPFYLQQRKDGSLLPRKGTIATFAAKRVISQQFSVDSSMQKAQYAEQAAKMPCADWVDAVVNMRRKALTPSPSPDR